MIKNYLLITLRSMMKSKLFIFINIFGLAIAIGCCVVAFFNYKFNADFDAYHRNAGSIYRISSLREFQNEQTLYGIVPMALGNVLRQSHMDVDKVVRFNFGGMNLKLDDQIFREDIKYVDPEFFEIFTFEFIHGNATDFRDKSKLFITDELAIKLFNSTDVVGKMVSQILDGDSLKEFQIGGVFKKPPLNSSFVDAGYAHFDNYFDVAPELDENNWYYRTTVFVQINQASRVSKIENQLLTYTENNNKVREDFIIKKFVMDPLVGMAARDRNSNRPGIWTRYAGPLSAVVGCAVMAIMIMLIACFNLTNTSLAISSRRLKEIGIRKVLGSMRRQLILQFIGETTFICLVALGIGLAIASFFFIPAFNALWPYMKLDANYLGPNNFLLFISIILIVTALLAGAYPAVYISKFEPVAILKGKLKFGGMTFLSMILLVLQFMISLIGIISSIAFVQNARYQRDINQGFDQKGVVFTFVNNGNEYEVFKNELLKNADILSIAGCKHHIGSSSYNDPVKYEEMEIETDIMEVGDNYLKTAGITLLEGRDFSNDSGTDRKESIIVTEAFVQKMGWDKPIGKKVVWQDTISFYVVGVVKDIYTRGLWRKVEPLMFRYAPKEQYTHVIVSAPAGKITDVNQYMEKRWKEVFPNRLYSSTYMDQQTNAAIIVNDNIVKMFVFLGAVAMMLSATGLFTLVSLNIIKRLKEIGVRKVLGASVGNIARIVNGKFVMLLVVASLLGSVFGSFLVNSLMNSIWAFYQPVNGLTFVISIALMFIIAMLTIGFKVFSTARMNPVSSLKDE